MFRSTGGKGFHIEFKNGYCVSVQFGPSNYCDNRDASRVGYDFTEDVTCENAEIAVWEKDGKWCTRRAWHELFSETLDDDVVGCVLPNALLKVLNWAEAQP